MERLARLRAVVESIAVQLADAEHRRDEPRSLVAADDARRLSLAEQPLEVVDRLRVEPELLVEQARVPERVVEEGPEGIGPPVGDATVGLARGLVVPQRLDVRGVEVGHELHELRRPEIALERAQLVEPRARPLLVGVLHQLANGHVGDAMGREPARHLLHVAPALVAVAALDAERGEAKRRLGLVLAPAVSRDRFVPGGGAGDVPGVGRRLRRVPASLVLVSLARPRERRPVVVVGRRREASGALVAGGGAEGRVVGGAVRDGARARAQDQGGPEAAGAGRLTSRHRGRSRRRIRLHRVA